MLVLVLASVLTAAIPNVELQTVSGQTITGAIAAISAERLAVDNSGARVEFRVDELITLSVKEPDATSGPVPTVWIDLIDGSSLVAQGYTIRGDQAHIRLGRQTLEVSRKDLVSVRFQRPNDALTAEWRRILEARHAADLLVIRKNDALDYHQGVIGDVTDSEVQFELDGDRLPVKRAKVAGLAYYHPPGRVMADSVCRITDVEGSVWAVRTMALGDKLDWTTGAGVKMSRLLSQVRRIEFSSDKVMYLSDLQPESSRWTPYFRLNKDLPSLSQFYTPRSDRNLRGGKLELAGRQYAKGLALHTRTTLVYRLPDRFRRFKATAGIDDSFRPSGQVRLIIRGDERVLMETTITGEQPPLEIDVDLTDVRRLTILADFGAGIDVGSHLLLCEARVIR